MNFKAGEDLPTRMNLGGGEIEGTYWVKQVGTGGGVSRRGGNNPGIAESG